MSEQFFNDIKSTLSDADSLLVLLLQENLNEHLQSLTEQLFKRLNELNKQYPKITWKKFADQKTAELFNKAPLFRYPSDALQENAPHFLSTVNKTSAFSKKFSYESSALFNFPRTLLRDIYEGKNILTPDSIKASIMLEHLIDKKSKNLFKKQVKKYCCLSKVEVKNVQLYAFLIYKNQKDKTPAKALFLKDLEARVYENRLLLKYTDCSYEFEAQTEARAYDWLNKIDHYRDYIKPIEVENITNDSKLLSYQQSITSVLSNHETPDNQRQSQMFAEIYEDIKDHHVGTDDVIKFDRSKQNLLLNNNNNNFNHNEIYDDIFEAHELSAYMKSETPQRSVQQLKGLFNFTKRTKSSGFNYDKLYLCLYDTIQSSEIKTVTKTSILKFRRGDLIEFIKIVSSNFFIGKLKDVCGLVPFSHVTKMYIRPMLS